MQKKIIIIGNPENRRVKLFQKALFQKGYSSAQVLSYESYLQKKDLSNILTKNSIIRIESPGENFQVTKKIIKLGAKTAGEQNQKKIKALTEDYGKIQYPKYWFLGYQKLLKKIKLEINQFKKNYPNAEISFMNDPQEIITMFDKKACHDLCKNSEIQVPKSLKKVESYLEFKEAIYQKKMKRVFIKLNTSSSASGIVAYETNGKQEQIKTTIEVIKRGKNIFYYNSLKVRKYTDPKLIENLLNWLINEEVHIEQWIPKYKIEDQVLDVRVMVINKKVMQKVVRLSKKPFTNLHLNNKRGLQSLLSQKIWQKIKNCAEKTMKLFPHSLYAGLDILIARNEKIYLLEVNAFGDLLPGILYNGMSTYEAEIEFLKNNL